MSFMNSVRQLEQKLDAAQVVPNNSQAVSDVIKEITTFAKNAKPTTQKQRDDVARLVELGKIAQLGKIGD
jgi:hypothetical protein